MNEAFCYKCKHKKTCIEICPDLEIYLKELEKGIQGNVADQSGNYIDQKYGKEDDHIDEAEKRKAWERRCIIVREAIQYFESFGSQALRYFLAWRYVVDEELSQQEIAELMGISQPWVSKIITKIKTRKDIKKAPH